MLTKQDLDQIEELIEKKLEEKIKHLPTKDEFYEAMDKIMKELKTIREEHTIESYRVRDHEKRIAKLEKRVFAS